MQNIAGFILAGGESRRMGTDKSQLALNGKSFVDLIAKELASVTRNITVVGNRAAGLKHVADIHPKWGSLGGVHTALASCSEPWAMIVACDFPFVTGALFKRLAEWREGFAAVAPIQNDDIPQPLCALYKIDPCLRRADELINSGERKPIALLQSVQTRWVRFAEISELIGAQSFFENINTPEDYDRIVKKGAVSSDSDQRQI